jgi:hypothetical protein
MLYTPPATEYRVWCVTGDLLGEFDNYSDASHAMHHAMMEDYQANGVMPGQDDYSVQVIEDGQDVSTDPSPSREWNQW